MKRVLLLVLMMTILPLDQAVAGAVAQFTGKTVEMSATTSAYMAPDVPRIGLTDFVERCYPKYITTNYQRLLDQVLEQVALYIETGGQQGIGRLMVFMPPRHGKSLKVSKLFPAWLLGRNPDKRLIMASYGARLATRNSRFVRNMIKSDLYQQVFPGVRISRDTGAANEWDIANNDGGAISAGVDGGITGHGAHLLLIDDPIKSRAEAESPTYRENLQDWYSDAYTRLEEPGGAVVLMHTRWHQEDLAGYLLSEDLDGWHVLCLPAIALEDDPLGRGPGEALWPERYTVEKLQAIEKTLGDYRFAAEYQQQPQPKAGGLFDTQLIQVVDYTPECIRTVRFYDLAVTKKKTSDYTAGVKMGITADGSPVILDVFRRQLTAPEVQDAITQNAAIDGTATRIYLEAEKAGIVQLDYLLRDARMHRYAIEAIPPLGDKYTRAGPFASRVAAGKAQMVRAAWNRAYLDELAMFPRGAHDDQVDASSGAYERLATGAYTAEDIERMAANKIDTTRMSASTLALLKASGVDIEQLKSGGTGDQPPVTTPQEEV